MKHLYSVVVLNKTVYTAAEVTCGPVGVMIKKVIKAFGQEGRSRNENAENAEKAEFY